MATLIMCFTCSRSFPDVKALAEHVVSRHSEGPWVHQVKENRGFGDVIMVCDAHSTIDGDLLDYTTLETSVTCPVCKKERD